MFLALGNWNLYNCKFKEISSGVWVVEKRKKRHFKKIN